MLNNDSYSFSKTLEQFSQVRVLIIGDLMLDRFFWGSVQRISPEAPVPIVEVQRESAMPGGAANVSNNIASLTGKPYLCGVVGKDEYSKQLIQKIQESQTDCSGIIEDEQRITTVKDRVIAYNQQVVRIDREVKDDITEEQHDKLMEQVVALMPSINIVIIEDYGKGLITPQLIQNIVREAHKHNVLIAVDPKEKYFDYYANVDVITPNHHEAEKVTGITIKDNLSLCQCGEALLKKINCKAVLLTRGEHGMSLFQKDKAPLHIPTVAQEVFDVSGAGDTVIATFALALGAGSSLEEATYLSNIAGGVVVGKVGVAAVTIDELKATLCKQLV